MLGLNASGRFDLGARLQNPGIEHGGLPPPLFRRLQGGGVGFGQAGDQGFVLGPELVWQAVAEALVGGGDQGGFFAPDIAVHGQEQVELGGCQAEA